MDSSSRDRASGAKRDAAGNGKASSKSAKPTPKRDPLKRREQNRQSQKTYREKQRRRVEELERIAAAAADHSSDNAATQQASSVLTAGGPHDTEQGVVLPDTLDSFQDTIDPSVLETSTDLVPFQDMSDLIDPAALLADFDPWLDSSQLALPTPATSTSPSTSHSCSTATSVNEVFYDCGCTYLHVRMPASSVLVRMTPSPFVNTLRLDVWCALAGLLENCLLLGIPKAHFCGDDSESPFYRRGSSERESAQLAVSVLGMTSRSISAYDLRPSRAQVVHRHHPYIDVLPFRDLRENLIRAVVDSEGGRGPIIDEDDFLLDYFNHVTCWGGVAGAKTGTPWDGRSWEASEFFLKKWALVVGGEDGELTRQSRWWRAMRGETGTGTSAQRLTLQCLPKHAPF